MLKSLLHRFSTPAQIAPDQQPSTQKITILEGKFFLGYMERATQKVVGLEITPISTGADRVFVQVHLRTASTKDKYNLSFFCGGHDPLKHVFNCTLPMYVPLEASPLDVLYDRLQASCKHILPRKEVYPPMCDTESLRAYPIYYANKNA